MRVTGLSRDTGAAEGSALFTKAREVFLFKVSLRPITWEKASPNQPDPYSVFYTGLSNSNNLKCYCVKFEATFEKHDTSETAC